MDPVKAYNKRELKAEPGRVILGAKFLDKHHPGWYNEIKITTLNMDDGEKCVLGQLYGSFLAARLKLKILSCIDMGFYSPKRLWLKEIEKRKTK